MRKRILYGLFYKDEEVDRGSAREISDKYDISMNVIKNCANNNYLLKKTYEVKKIGYCNEKSYQYYAYKGGTLIYKGNKSDLCIALGVNGEAIENAIHKDILINDYAIIRILVDTDKLERLRVYREVSPQENNKKLAYLKRHLNEYGNTVLGCIKEDKVKEYMSKLKEEGYNVRYKKVRDTTERRNYYIVEKG